MTISRPILARNTRLIADRLGTLVVKDHLGSGGQGQVFRVATEDGTARALKLYYPPGRSDRLRRLLSEQRAALLGANKEPGLIKRGPPNSSFIWPLDFVPHEGTFGYLMDLIPDGFESLERLMRGRATIDRTGGPYRALCNLCFNLVEAFEDLHRSGLVYMDINLGGPHFNFSTDEVMICDNDNVRIDGTEGRIFFPGFAAPEVVTGAAACSINSDLHALAVLLFHVWVRGSPFEGESTARIAALNEKAKLHFFGEKPVFCFHPIDRSNAPVSGIHDFVRKNWRRLPEDARAIFQRVFVGGVLESRSRPTNREWRKTLFKMRDALARCPSCGLDTFASVGDGSTITCGWCGSRSAAPPRIEVGKNSVWVGPDAQVMSWHLDPNAPKGGAVVAQVEQHPTVPNRWGLANVGERPWRILGGPEVKLVPPGKRVGLRIGLRLDLGGKTLAVTE